MRFKEFLLNEDRAYLGLNIGNILTGLQNLVDNGKSMNMRQLNLQTEEIVAKIRNVLKGSWPKEEQQSLKVLQNVAVALIKAVKEQGDIHQVLPSAVASLQTLMQDLKVPFNNLQSLPQQK